MPYRTILVHVDESSRASERIKLAAAVAMTEGAHLIGTAVTGASRFAGRSPLLAERDPGLQAHLGFLQLRGQRGLEDFEAAVLKLGLPSFEKRLVDDEAGGGVCLQARFADLVVIGQVDPNEISPVVMSDFPEYVIHNCSRPVLLVPREGQFDNIGQRVLIAWDASMEATRAVTDALPLLRRANAIDLVVFNGPTQGQRSGPRRADEKNSGDIGDDVALYLRRHDIKVEVLRRRTDKDIGTALLALASSLGSDLIIMGAYCHTRFREFIPGAVTRTVLDSMTVPVLMSH